MTKKDPRIDAYIAKAQSFAQPILKHYRELVHKVCPDVEEKMKWSFPHYDYKGEMMTSMAAFKQHCAVNFWKAALMKDYKKMSANQETAMGHLGKITSLKDLPSDKILTSYIKEAMKLTDEGKKLPAREIKVTKEVLAVPLYFKNALAKNKKAKEHFEKFAPGQKKEYITWLTEAKTEETREKRLETAMQWISEGKIRNWKYLKK
jgi:uncharacterized protein YdeI (YjbR/CyaY-like superfamily)